MNTKHKNSVRKFKWLGLLLALSLVLAACAGGPNQTEATPGQTGITGTPVMDLTGTPVSIPATGEEPEEQAQSIIDSETMVFASNVIGATLVGQGGETLGEITDLAYDPFTSQVIYAILSPEGSGDSDVPLNRQTAFPWGMKASGEVLTGEKPDETAEGSQVPDTMVFNGDADLLRNAPSLATDALAEEEFNLWSTELYGYWREVGDAFHTVGVNETTTLQKLSGLTSLEAVRGETRQSYPARDIVINLSTGQILYIVLEAGNLFPGESGLVMIPYDYLRYGPMEDGGYGFVFTAEDDHLQTLPRLQETDIPGEQ